MRQSTLAAGGRWGLPGRVCPGRSLCPWGRLPQLAGPLWILPPAVPSKPTVEFGTLAGALGPAGPQRVFARYEPGLVDVAVVPDDTVQVVFELAAVHTTTYEWAERGPAIEFRPDSGVETTSLAPNLRIRTVLGLRPPVKVATWTPSHHAAAEIVLSDSCGSALQVSWPAESHIKATGETTRPPQPRLLWFGAPVAAGPPGHEVPVGSPLETALLDVLRNWADTEIPRGSQDSLAAIWFDSSAEDQKAHLRTLLDADQWRALYVVNLIQVVERQRTAVGLERTR